MSRLATVVLLAVLGLVGARAPAGAPAPHGLAVVVVPGAPGARAALAAVDRLRASGTDVDLRTPRSLADQIGALHLLAAAHAATIVTVGVDRRRAAALVAARYPATHIVRAPSAALMADPSGSRGSHAATLP